MTDTWTDLAAEAHRKREERRGMLVLVGVVLVGLAALLGVMAALQ